VDLGDSPEDGRPFLEAAEGRQRWIITMLMVTTIASAFLFSLSPFRGLSVDRPTYGSLQFMIAKVLWLALFMFLYTDWMLIAAAALRLHRLRPMALKCGSEDDNLRYSLRALSRYHGMIITLLCLTWALIPVALSVIVLGAF